MNTLRLCSYNIHKGMSTSNRRHVLADIRHAIRLLDADLVCLQEVVGNALTQHGRDNSTASQFEFLADEVWPHQAYGQNAVYTSGHHGNAILSKNPFRNWRNIDISYWRFSQRGILLGQLNIGVYVVCLHLGLIGHERQMQLQKLIALVENEIPAGAPLIIAGDFNDWTMSLDRQLKSRLGLQEVHSCFHRRPARSFPALWPVLAMDRIYFRNLVCQDMEVLSGQPWQRMSDHCALYCEFRL